MPCNAEGDDACRAAWQQPNVQAVHLRLAMLCWRFVKVPVQKLSQSVKPATVKARESAVQELAEWLQSTEAITGRTMSTALSCAPAETVPHKQFP